MALHGSRLPGISRSDRGRFLPLPDHRDTSLISWHCHSMTVAGRMPARASTAVARPAYRAKKRTPCFGVSSMKATMKYYHFFLSSRLYCRYRNLTGSAVNTGRGLLPPVGNRTLPRRISFYSVVYYMPLYVLFQGIFHINRRFNFFTNFIPEGYYNVYKVFPSQGVSHESLFSFCKHAPPLRL